MAHKIFLFNFFILPVFLATCNSIEPPPPPPDEKPTLTLELDDAQCTEVWINFTTTKLQLPDSIILKQFNPGGDSISTTINLTTSDSLVYIDSLLPNANYTFQASSIQHKVSSNVLSVTTMDTTSHNFVWQMFTFGGEISSSVLHDVAIIDENDIWAVGEIWIVDDTSSLGYTKYNAVHWDGVEWALKRIRYYGSCSAVEYPPLNAIWAFAENDIIITNGGSIGFFDGINVNLDCRVNPLLTGEIKKIWGTSSNDLYIVGNSGNIAHYNGQIWSRVESGTELNINDIWGDYNQKTQEWEILVVASNIFHSLDKEVIKIDNTDIQTLNINGIEETLRSVWFESNRKYYVVGSGTYEKNKLTEDIWKGDPLDITNYFENRIRGNDINDVYVVGAFGEFLHFNGVRWKSHLNETGLFNGAFLSVDVKNNLVVSVGYEATQAKIMTGQITQ